MAAIGGGSDGGADDRAPGRAVPDPSVAELLQKLHLTADEGEVADFSDAEEEGMAATVEWALLGKVISPMALHANTIRAAMTPAWGNPYGLKIRSIGEKGDNLFVAEFGCKADMDRVRAGTPWIAGKHAVILKEYDEKLKPSEIRFDRMEIWVRILNLPLGWMNQQRGIRAMQLLGDVKKMDVDNDGKASGAFLRARVSIALDKPIKRGVLLRMSKVGDLEWFDAQYEKLPFLCFSCGLLGHGGMGCDKPALRNDQGKLPYERDPPLRAPEDRRRKLQGFVEAAAESYGSGSSSSARPSRSMSGRSGERRDVDGREEEQRSTDATGSKCAEEEEITSPLKSNAPTSQPKEVVASDVGRRLFQVEKGDGRKVARKRKPRRTEPTSIQTPDLNLPLEDAAPLVPAGLVSSRVSQLGGARGGASGEEGSEELLKKQKRATQTTDVGSAAAARSSPRRAP
ncbi:unnamed protein product [Urochloa humidicola]